MIRWRLSLCATVISMIASLAVGWTDGFFLDESIPVGLEENLERSRVIGRGVTQHQAYTWVEPYFLNWVWVDRDDEGLMWRAVKAHDRVEGNRPLSEMAAEAGIDDWCPVAALNADFWASGGGPVGLCVVDGRLLTLGNGRPAVMQTGDGELHMDRFHFEVDLEFDEQGRDSALAIDDVNLPAHRIAEDDPSHVVIYTGDSVNEEAPIWPPARLGFTTDWSAVALRLEEPTELAINQAIAGELVAISEADVAERWPDDLILVVGYGASAEGVAALPLGEDAELEIECEEVSDDVAWALGGGPILLRDGEVVVTEEGEPGFRSSFITTRHPRSLIGWNDDGVILAVVDGRQPDLSQGMGLVECAEWMRDQGATHAMNFDGGGSSSLWARGETASSPSDAGGERSVTDGLVLLSDVPFDVAAHNPPPDFNLGALAHWEFHPTRMEIVSGETQRFFPRAFSAEGERVRVPASGGAVNFTVWPSDLAEIVRTEDGGWALRGVSVGSGSCILRERLPRDVQEREGIAYEIRESPAFEVIVGQRVHELVDSLETAAELPSHEFTGMDPELTHLAWDTETVQDGERALALDYAMEHGGTSAAYIHLNVPLPEDARRAGLWVCGDGGEAWLRGIISDADGERFIVDFTNGTQGINWEDWQWVHVGLSGLRAHWDNPEAHADAPYKLATIYIAQTREAKKTSGRVLFDAVGAEVFRAP
ncbi:phosphodiester glycosidase family protein [Candidatus Sumerlaeota bacterium]|nr:phosphodiester glycosidase family protein [Candidatus Sumerlaeota bacterium]